MGMVITNNVSALNTQRWLNTNQSNMQSSLEKLSSGYRINTGADDPAGLVISEKLRAQNAGLERAVQNTQEAMNVIGIAEGALNEMNSILSTMRELALHASNSGVTSPDQVEADQAEMDSAIQTIDRIANTTKYSDQFLLNGNQALTYTRSTTVDSTSDESLLDLGLTSVNQIYKTDDYSINISFSGANAAQTQAITSVSAQRAYLEATAQTTGTEYDSTTGLLTGDQAFVISGNNGSKSFSFSTGTSLGDIASTINDVSDSTGVGAALVFDSTVNGTNQTVAGNTTYTTHATGEQMIFNFTSAGALVASGATAGGVISTSAITGVNVGANTDADGKIYVKWTGSGATASYVAYKDEDMTMEVGRGNAGTAMTATNSSGLGITITSNATTTAGMTSIICAGPALEFSSTAASCDNGITTDLSSTMIVATESAVSGIKLGENTDANGKIYVKITAQGAGSTISLYSDSGMSDDSLIATSAAYTSTAASCVNIYDEDTGLMMQLNTAAIAAASNGTYTGTISCTDLALRLYSTDYGSDEFVKVEAETGALFTDGDGNLLDSGVSGAEAVDYGQDAIVTVNGQRVQLDGTSGTVSTADLNAKLVFDEGELGATTIAVAGYEVGSLASKIGAMSDNTNDATQALNNTTEVLNDFQGGMQFQLGEGSGDQERTVYGIDSVSASSLGQVQFVDDFDGDGTTEEQMLSVSDLLGGGYASLATDAVKALDIIDQAIDDVSSLRARLGATQSNLLQTNINSLNVAIENITATESAIRDVDMATETTEFTKNQILVQSATAMLAQANTASQNVLSLLG